MRCRWGCKMIYFDRIFKILQKNYKSSPIHKRSNEVLTIPPSRFHTFQMLISRSRIIINKHTFTNCTKKKHYQQTILSVSIQKFFPFEYDWRTPHCISQNIIMQDLTWIFSCQMLRIMIMALWKWCMQSGCFKIFSSWLKNIFVHFSRSGYMQGKWFVGESKK